MQVKEITDLREWIYDLTKDEPEGKMRATGESVHIYGGDNKNVEKTLSGPKTIMVGGSTVELPAGSKVVVYRRLSRNSIGGWQFSSSSVSLATIFVQGGNRFVRQISIRMNGSVYSKQL